MNSSHEAPSWLTLERYALDELSPSERAAIGAAIATDPGAQECLRQIRADRRELPSLPPIQVAIKAPKQRVSLRAVWAAASVGVALTAIALLVRQAPWETRSRSMLTGAKGDAIEVTLVRESEGRVAVDPALFTLNDRFKVRVTCGRAGLQHVDVVAYQNREASFPLNAQQIVCGNNVVLEGAFRLNQLTDAEVCVVLSEDVPVARGRLADAHPVPETAACTLLTPAR